MSTRRNPQGPFLLVLLDESRKVFTVVGPMADDTEWNSRVDKAQKQGRQVTIYQTAHPPLSRVQVIADAQLSLGPGYRYVNEDLVSVNDGMSPDD